MTKEISKYEKVLVTKSFIKCVIEAALLYYSIISSLRSIDYLFMEEGIEKNKLHQIIKNNIKELLKLFTTWSILHLLKC